MSGSNLIMLRTHNFHFKWNFYWGEHWCISNNQFPPNFTTGEKVRVKVWLNWSDPPAGIFRRKSVKTRSYEPHRYWTKADSSYLVKSGTQLLLQSYNNTFYHHNHIKPPVSVWSICTIACFPLAGVIHHHCFSSEDVLLNASFPEADITTTQN